MIVDSEGPDRQVDDFAVAQNFCDGVKIFENSAELAVALLDLAVCRSPAWARVIWFDWPRRSATRSAIEDPTALKAKD